jgi:purine-cytosine permease-like protein
MLLVALACYLIMSLLAAAYIAGMASQGEPFDFAEWLIAVIAVINSPCFWLLIAARTAYYEGRRL